MSPTGEEDQARAVLARAVEELDRGLGILAEAEDRWYRATTDEQRWESAAQAQEAAEVLLDVRADLDAAFGDHPGIRPAMAALWHRAGLWLASSFLLTARAAAGAGDAGLARSALAEASDLVDASMGVDLVTAEDQALLAARRADIDELAAVLPR
ncbi:MAG: hypothetical protein U0Q07_14755 [Acidimicrobiales bacterium]